MPVGRPSFLPSPNVDDRPDGCPVDMLILHYTGMTSARVALDRLRDPLAKVSAHYLIDEDGSVVALVPEERRAWHAGVSHWRGADGLNDRSIGIELVNPGHEFGYRPFTPAQYEALVPLATAILERWPIPARNVVGHSDVAPERKKDPGELFDWPRLARAGIGVLPEEEAAPDAVVIAGMQRDLREIGYRVPDHGRVDAATRRVIVAFQRHFRPARVDGVPDDETLGRIAGLLALARTC